MKGKRKSKTRPVTVYLTVMFAAALLLLLVSFFMQQRNHAAIMDLNETVDAAQMVNQLKLENQQLEYALTGLQEDMTALQTERDGLAAQFEAQQKQTQAMEWLRELESASRTSYAKALELLAQFQATGLADSLPEESVVEGGLSPAEVYRNLVDSLT